MLNIFVDIRQTNKYLVSKALKCRLESIRSVFAGFFFVAALSCFDAFFKPVVNS